MPDNTQSRHLSNLIWWMNVTVMPVIIFKMMFDITFSPETRHFFFRYLILAATEGRHTILFGDWLNYNRLICKIGFWLNKFCASSVKCYCFVGSAPECCWGEMKTKQDAQRALRLFLSPRGFLWNANCCIRNMAVCCDSLQIAAKTTTRSVIKHGISSPRSQVWARFISHFYDPSSTSFFIIVIIIRCH